MKAPAQSAPAGVQEVCFIIVATAAVPMRAALLIAAVLVPGCVGMSFEARFNQGLQAAHMQGSPPWRDPGLYDAVPEDGEFHGFDVSTGNGPPMVVMPADTPTRLGFHSQEIADAWGPHRLGLVRWREGGDDARGRADFHLDPESLQGWVGRELADDEVRARFRFVAPQLLDASGQDLRRLEDEFMASRRDLGLRVPDGHGTGAGIDGVHHIVNWRGPVRAQQLFVELGGLAAFEPVPRHQALLLPSPGQIDLVQGAWEFALETALKTLRTGPFADTHALLVTPDDSALYVHWGAADLSDREAGERLRATMRRLDRTPPETTGWAFSHERIEGGPG